MESYAKGETDPPLIDKTIGDFLDQTVSQFGAKEALVSVFENKRLTWSAFQEEINRCARALMALGVQKGGRIGIWSVNCTAWVIAQFATAKIGSVLVTLNPAYRLHELEYALQQSECNFLISGAGFKDADYEIMLLELIPELGKPGTSGGLNSKKFSNLKQVIFLEGSKKGALGGLSWNAMVSRFEQTRPEALAERQASLHFNDVINIQYTSGTTGFPKGAMLTHRGLLNNGHGVGTRMGLHAGDRLCIPVPFYHCFGMVLGNLACVSHGAVMVLPSPHFSPLATLEAIARERCTAVHGVPSMFVAELEHPRFEEFDLSSLRTGIMAGAPCPIEVMKQVIEKMHCSQITIACGMTEASPVCNMTGIHDPIDLRVGTVGRVMPHQEQKIIDPVTRQILRRGSPGEICYRGYQVMRGYDHHPKGAEEAMDSEGWLHSGDLAVMDETGYVKITGRLKDMIIRGGENIYPREIEEFLFSHPKIAEAYVIGVPDPYYGEQVMAWIRLREGQKMDEDEVLGFCRGNIMDYKIPHYIRFVSEFPTTVTGKIQKFRMREISVAELSKNKKTS